MAVILVVDDEPELVRFVKRALEANGHQAVTALSGVEGLSKAVARPPDLVILDLLMPALDGRAVLSGLLSAQPDARVLVLSAMSDVRARVEALEAGAVDFLAKPFVVRELLARVHCQLRKAGAAVLHDNEVTVNGATLNVRERTLTINGRAVALSQREFLLLLHLMRRAGDVCSREELLSEVWGLSFDPSTNVVDVYVARLRHKLQDDMIRTVRNVGYQLQGV